jgi:hypothetical protein
MRIILYFFVLQRGKNEMTPADTNPSLMEKAYLITVRFL